MVEQLKNRFEGIVAAAKFVTQLSTQRFLRKRPVNVDGLLVDRPKLLLGSIGRLRLVASASNAGRYPFSYSGPSLSHTRFPFAWLQDGLYQLQGAEGAGQSIHNEAKLDHSNQYVHGVEEGTFLDESIKRRLSRWLDLRLPQIRVHTGPLLDELLDKHSAHAMTIGGDIYVRTDKFHPESAQGLALLGHEMTHVAQQFTAPTLSSIYDTARQERAALESEQHVHRRMRADSAPSSRMVAGHEKLNGESIAPVRSLDSSGAMTPMFADAGRSVPSAEPSVPESVLSDHEMSRIKQEVYRDIMQKMRIEIERGA